MDNVRKWKKHSKHRRRRGQNATTTPPPPTRDPVPFITVQGKRYYSDRFYLNKTIYDDDSDDDSDETPANSSNCTSCTCGAHAPPPLLDRAAFVASLDLKAAILATYTLSPSWLVQREFPTLLGPHSTVPTLVLHGQKAWSPNNNNNSDSKKNRSSNDNQREATAYQTDSGGEEEEECWTQEEEEEEEQKMMEAKHQQAAAAADEEESDDISRCSLNTQPEEEEETQHVDKKAKVVVAAVPPPPPPVTISTTTTKSSTQNNNTNGDDLAFDTTTNHPNAVRNSHDDKEVMANSTITTTKPPAPPLQPATTTMSHDSTKEDATKATARSGSKNKKHDHHQKKKTSSSAAVLSTCPSHVHWTEVLPCWIPPTDVPAVYAAAAAASASAAANDKDSDDKQEKEKASSYTSTSCFSVSQTVLEKRKIKRGVHHPKFMILFETSGSVIVVVSTANLTPQRTTDGTWMQRFFPVSAAAAAAAGAAVDDNNNNNNAASSSSSSSSSATSHSNNDFGKTLAHLLQCQTWAAREGQWTPEAFCRKYLGFDNDQGARGSGAAEFPCALRDLYKRYDFSQAQVHLVSHVPGDYPISFGPSPAAKKKKSNDKPDESSRNNSTTTFRPYCYGRQRVASILEKLSKSSSSSSSLSNDGDGSNNNNNNGLHNRCWLPTSIVDRTDRLVIQPTSFGADWTPSNMADVVQSYLKLPVGFRGDRPSSTSTSNNDGQPTTSDWMQRTDIVWPTEDFMQQVNDKLKRRKDDDDDDRVSPTSALQMGLDDSGDEDELSVGRDGKRDNSGFIFLSSETFNRIHTDCLSRMVMFQHSSPAQHPSKPSPHFKSIARLYNGTNHRLYQDYSLGESNTQLSWFLLTSACLSLGAQGERSSTSKKQELSALPRGGNNETISFSNFELGVLFCSRLQGRPQSDRLYCWRPAECSCGTADKVTEYSKLIHLPVPFSFRRSPYQKDSGEMAFCETPYFNEIPPGTAGVGHMMYTPYGAAVAAELDRQES